VSARGDNARADPGTAFVLFPLAGLVIERLLPDNLLLNLDEERDDK